MSLMQHGFGLSGSLSYDKIDFRVIGILRAFRRIEANLTLTPERYQVIEQQAHVHACSVSDKVTSILAASLSLSQDSLTKKFDAWEAASDEDWLKMERF